MKNWWMRRVVTPLLDLLRQGVTPRQLALSLAVGFCLSTFPLLGVTSLLCFAAAPLLRLNLVALQLVNWLSAPLQVALLVPFYRTGQWLFDLREFPMTFDGLAHAFRDNFADTFAGMWIIVGGGTVVWLATIVPASLLFFRMVDALLRRWSLQTEASAGHA